MSQIEDENNPNWQQKRSAEPKTQIPVRHLNNDDELIIQVFFVFFS